MSEPLDVLAVAAHPDDAEVGCGGALLLAGQAGYRTGIVDLSAGEASTSGDPSRRSAERDRASSILGLSDRVAADLPDSAIGTDPAHRDAVVRVLRDLRPRVVLAPHADDRHPDHAAAGRLARDAAYLAGVAAVGSGEPHRPQRIYHYAIHHPVEPTVVLDVTAVWDRKMEAVRSYASQFGEGAAGTELAGTAFLDAIQARAAYHGAMVGVARAEAFSFAGPLLLAGFPELAVPPPDVPGYRMFR